jgi:hypothetical protein
MRRRLMSIVLLSLGGLVLPDASGHAASAAGWRGASPCRLVQTAEAAEILGSTVASVAHESVIAGSCSWRSSDPNCFMRVLSVERSREPKFGSEQWLALDLPSGSLFSNDVYPEGSSLAIEFLDVPVGHEWLHFSLLGRVGRAAAQDLLRGLANAIFDRGAPR